MSNRSGIIAFALLVLAASAYAQSAREQLQQMVEQLQKAPSDGALRERIIKLALSVKPSPVLPPEAERRMVRGGVAFNGATSVADYQAAAKEFEQATLAAPWYGDAYYNLGVAQDKAEDYEGALRSLKLAALASPDSKAAEKLSYAVEFRKEKAAAAKAAADTPHAREAALLQKVEGARFVYGGNRTPSNSGRLSYEDIFEVKGGILYWSIRIYSLGSGNTRHLSFHDHDQPGLYSVERASYRDGTFTVTSYGITCVYRIRPDSQALLRQCSNWRPNSPDDAIPRQ
jgi:tetratricopeptide (TPR) repeat protein